MPDKGKPQKTHLAILRLHSIELEQALPERLVASPGCLAGRRSLEQLLDGNFQEWQRSLLLLQNQDLILQDLLQNCDRRGDKHMGFVSTKTLATAWHVAM